MAAVEKTKIPNHAHCWICGRAIKFGDKVCSPECQTRYDEAQKKRKSLMWIMYGAMGFAVILILLQLTNAL